MEVAIVGLGCRFPQARDPVSFWDLVRDGRLAFSEIPASRFNHAKVFYDSSLRIPEKAYISRGAYLPEEDIREFGALHYGIAPRRVQVTDPQHRLLVDVVRAAVQDAGWEKSGFPRERAGVFVGASVSEFKEIALARIRAMQILDGQFGRPVDASLAKDLEGVFQDVVPLRAFSMPGVLLNLNAAIVSQTFDLGGPSLSVDAACSSALVAVHQAVQGLRSGQIDVAFAGGVYLNFTPDPLVAFSRIGAISRSGECRPFDASADGFVMGEGAGIVVLKRREDAEKDGDRIYALIRGIACNNDGRSEGPMTPRLEGQVAVLRGAYRDAAVEPASVGYIEAHGTATTVGDVVEVSALDALFREQGWAPERGATTALGSVKANFGHTMSAAGVAGLIKATLAVHRGVLPPQPSVVTENPKLGLGSGPFFLAREARPWQSEGPRRAGVSSFGFGGTNVHAVLEEAKAPRRARSRAPGTRPRAEVFLVSAPTPKLLARHARELAAAVGDADLPSVARTLASRAPSDARLAVVADSVASLREKLLASADAIEARPDGVGPLAPGCLFGRGPFAGAKIALLFAGQGAQRVGLLREAYQEVPAFRDALDRLDDSLGADLHQRIGGTLRSFLYPAVPGPDAERRLTETQVCQPAMAAVALALNAFLAKLGVHGDVFLGHSLGEFVAAAAGGAMSDEDCVRLVAERGLAMMALPLADRGAMLSAATDVATAREAVRAASAHGTIAIANLNHPAQTVLSGETGAIGAAAQWLEGRGIAVVRLDVSHAFHSPLVSGIADPMRSLVEALPLRAPSGIVVSGQRAAQYPSDLDSIRQIFVDHAASPVDFAGALRTAADLGARVFLQVGAGSTVVSFAKATVPAEQRSVCAPLASRDEDGLATLATAVGSLWTAGVSIEPLALFEGRETGLATLPPSPIETQPYWPIERTTRSAEPIRAAAPAAAEGDSMPAKDQDGLVALFREQVSVLQAHARILEQQTETLRGRGITEAGSSTPVPRPPLAIVPPPAVVPPAPERPAAQQEKAAAAPALPPPAPAPAHRVEEIAERVLASVSRISAFPAGALRTSQTLGAELGFDSLMTVELDSDLQKAWPGIGSLPRNLLGPSTTIQDVIEHVKSALAAPTFATPSPLSAALGAVAQAGPELFRFSPAVVAAPLPVVAPAENPVPAALLVTRDGHGIAEALARHLASSGHSVVVADLAAPASPARAAPDLGPRAWVCGGNDVVAEAARVLGPAFGIVHFAGTVPGPRLDSADPAAWEPLLEAQRLARAQDGFFVAVTAQDGKLGTTNGTLLGAAIAGHAKALARERTGEIVKAIDVTLEDSADAIAKAIARELRSGNAAPEVGLSGDERVEPDLTPARSGEEIAFDPGDVVLVTGGGRGVGAKLAVALSRSHASFVLCGRSPRDSRVDETVRAIETAGGRALYVQWDATQPAGDVLEAARKELGPFTALVHAAGVAEDGPASGKDDAAMLRVLGPKVFGLANALVATARDPLRAAILVGSWAGRFGNSGQVDYSAANAALSRAASLLPALRPGLRALALELPPWDGTAMVERIPAFARATLAEQGVPFLDDAAGERAFLDALRAGADGPVLIAQRRPSRRLAYQGHLAVSRSAQAYLEDHQLAGQPVLPLSVALDLMATAVVDATGSLAAPLVVRDFQLREPIRVPDAADLKLVASGEAGRELQVGLFAHRAGETRPPSRRPSYTGFVMAGGDPAPALAAARPAPPATSAPDLPLSLAEFYASYLFHGPRMRAVQSIEQLSPTGIVGWVKASVPGDLIARPSRAAWTVDPLALDGAFQLAAYWAWTQLGRAGFPIGIEEYVQTAPLAKGPLRASLTLEQASGDMVRGSIVLQDADGAVIAFARGVSGEFKHGDPRFLRARGLAVASPPPAATVPERVPVQAPHAPAAPAATRVDESTYRIEQFPEVQELEQRLGLAAAFGLKNPYFNVHERVTNDTSVIGGRTVINWSSYNYLGLSGDPHVTRAAQAAVERYGTSVSASRVASGEKPLHRELEQELASFLGCEDSMATVSGHGVFVTVIGHIMQAGDLILHDSLAHDCILGGAKLSGAKRRPFPHNDVAALEKQLAQLRPHYRRVLIAVEGVYSMDGDIAPLPGVIELKKKYGALLLVDEAHSFGVLGKTGRGVGEHFGLDRTDVDLWMGTMSKSLASCGGYVAGSKALIQYLKYTAPGFIYSVGISPANAAAALESLRQMQAHPEKVARLHERSALFLALAREKGIDTGFAGGSAVIPAILGNSLHSLQLSDALRQRGINVQPILYPAVEETAARLRFFVTATHTEQQIRETIEVLAEEIARIRAEGELQTGSV
ncbi:MAG: aminotransferase class I/II-fold pyridoxal phosphate-dependent enzyme [Myxococcales bacterium]